MTRLSNVGQALGLRGALSHAGRRLALERRRETPPQAEGLPHNQGLLNGES